MNYEPWIKQSEDFVRKYIRENDTPCLFCPNLPHNHNKVIRKEIRMTGEKTSFNYWKAINILQTIAKTFK